MDDETFGLVLEAEERRLWRRAAMVAERKILRVDSRKGLPPPRGAAHQAAEYADAIVEEFRRRYAASDH